ncbi:MAG TPA: N-6 DNA methylase, partial [Tenuifilaceae bacterium]|nr:N-6 DNA methylase [Tenuifilaceae bacterium]
PKVPANKKESMAIYLLFIQHIMYSLSETGKAAIVVPTGFLTAQSGIEKTIREQLVERGWLRGVVSMPSNIFASTGTNVSVVFMDKEADTEHIILVDASKLGETIKEGKSQRTVLTRVEEQRIIDAMNDKKAEEDFSVVVSKTELKDKNYSFSAGQYFEVRVDYVDISPDQFNERIKLTSSKLESLFDQSSKEESKLMSNLRMLIYENPESL